MKLRFVIFRIPQGNRLQTRMGQNISLQGEKDSKSKGQGGGEDRISELPDTALCHILSFLETKYAVVFCLQGKKYGLVFST